MVCFDPLDDKRKCECTTYMIITFASPEQDHNPYSRVAFGRQGFGNGVSVSVFQYSCRQDVLEDIAIQEQSLPASIGIGSVRYVCVCVFGRFACTQWGEI
jgi:hypothetical protein